MRAETSPWSVACPARMSISPIIFCNRPSRLRTAGAPLVPGVRYFAPFGGETGESVRCCQPSLRTCPNPVVPDENVATSLPSMARAPSLSYVARQLDVGTGSPGGAVVTEPLCHTANPAAATIAAAAMRATARSKVDAPSTGRTGPPELTRLNGAESSARADGSVAVDPSTTPMLASRPLRMPGLGALEAQSAL